MKLVRAVHIAVREVERKSDGRHCSTRRRIEVNREKRLSQARFLDERTERDEV